MQCNVEYLLNFISSAVVVVNAAAWLFGNVCIPNITRISDRLIILITPNRSNTCPQHSTSRMSHRRRFVFGCGIIEPCGWQVPILTTRTHTHARIQPDKRMHIQGVSVCGQLTLNYCDILPAIPCLVCLCLLKVLLQLYCIDAIFY